MKRLGPDLESPKGKGSQFHDSCQRQKKIAPTLNHVGAIQSKGEFTVTVQTDSLPVAPCYRVECRYKRLRLQDQKVFR